MRKLIKKLTLATALIGLIAVQMPANAAEEDDTEITAKLTDFTEDFWYPIPVEMEDGTPTHVDTLCPMAEFAVILPTKSRGKIIRIIYAFEESKKQSSLELVRKSNSGGLRFQFTIPRMDSENNIWYIDADLVRNLRLEHNKRFEEN